MGTLRSLTDFTGTIYYGVLLGTPVEKDGDPNTFEWDDSAFPNGLINPDGSVTIDQEDI
ncbi:MAG: hypothetical protein ACR2IJ_02415 [Fluviibacter sp.]